MMISLTMTGKAMRRIPRNKEKQEEHGRGKETGMKETVDNVLDDIAAKRAAASEKAGQENRETSPKKEFKEITMKFGKGCVGEEFQGKDGNKYKEILVPNPDKNDHRPWQTFVVKANHVHEDETTKK